MPEPHLLAALMAAAFAGAFVQAAFGFGFALLAAPLFLIVMQSGAAMQVLVALHVVQSALLVPGLWRKAPREMLMPLLAGSLAGFPLGLALFLALDLGTLKLTVGLVMLAFTALLVARDLGWLSRRRVPAAPPSRLAAAGVGVAAGSLTPIMVLPGPPLILYVAARRLDKADSRALSLTFFAFCYVVVTLLHVLWSGMSAGTWAIVGWLSPAVIAATLLGALLARSLSEARFRAGIIAVSLLSGAWLVWSAQ
jgi:uncharacterized membrane protein YfcA